MKAVADQRRYSCWRLIASLPAFACRNLVFRQSTKHNVNTTTIRKTISIKASHKLAACEAISDNMISYHRLILLSQISE